MNKTPVTLQQWRKSPLGLLIHDAEQRLLHQTLSNSSGSCLVQWSHADDYALETITDFEESIYLSSSNDFKPLMRGLQVDPRALPMLSDSTDILFLPYTLELSTHPKLLLKEAYRILRQGGYVIILNFNPASFWGLSKLFHTRKNFPWQPRMVSALHLRYRLAKLGFSITQYKTDFFRPLFNDPEKLEKWQLFETVGQMCWPFLGSVYMMVAQKKREVLMSAKTKPKHAKNLFSTNVPQPATRACNETR